MNLRRNPERGGRSGRPPKFQHRADSHVHAHTQNSAGEQTRHHDHPLACADLPQLVTRQDELTELIMSLKAARSFAYDSEFIGELTYLPRLCLIQAASTTRIALIDPLADGLDVRPFWELVADPSIEKIVHAGLQDVEPVFRALGTAPANLFDTQIAAGFAGVGYPLSLSKLVMTFVGAKLGKGLTFSHWDHRPLTDHQLRYAADDVRYLPAARHEIGKRLGTGDRAKWVLEESATLADPSLHVFDPQTQWIKFRGAAALPPLNQAILRQLTVWRDSAAQAEDVPPRTLLRDEILMDMARWPVETEVDLNRIKGLPRPIENKYGSQIVEATKTARAMPAGDWPSIAAVEPSPQEKFRADCLFIAAQCIAAGQNIDPALLTSRQEIGEFVRNFSSGQVPTNARILRGWRREAVGQALLDLLQKNARFTFEWKDGSLQAAPSH